jgi:tetrapyrrole methylase family protein/MazG family protein
MIAQITIVGLGPGDPEQITLKAWKAIEGASEVRLRTKHHPSVDSLPEAVLYHSFDDVYENHDSYTEVYEEIATRVVDLGERPQGVVYAVPGHPLMGETAVPRILELARERGLSTRVIAGVSFLEPVTTALGIDPFDGLQVCDAMLLGQRHHPDLCPDVGALIVQVCDRYVASRAKITLMNLYHEDHPIHLVRHAGTERQQVRELPLYELDRQEDLDHLTTAYIPPLSLPGSVSGFQNVVARLRAPGGCPWDRKQTHQTLRSELLEETYEVLAALDAEDMEGLKEELGDLMLQILFHAQIATEDGDFKLIDSNQHIIEKLVRRHPHVFGEEQVEDAEEVLQNWERIKREERGEEAFSSMLSGINKALPALSQAMEIQRRVARVGFDWSSAEPVSDKVREELEEFRQASDAAECLAEMGDLLFSLVNVARWHEIDPESALRQANQRFMERFAGLERQAQAQDLSLEEMTLQEMDALWEQAKDAFEAEGESSE